MSVPTVSTKAAPKPAPVGVAGGFGNIAASGATAMGLAPPGGFAPSTTATAKSAHAMLIAVGLELAFVVVATMLAGISDAWGSGMLALMLAMLILRGLFQVNVFGSFVNNNPLTPGEARTSSAGGSSGTMAV